MFKIIAQYDDFIVVDKAAGVDFHDEGNIGSGFFSQVKKSLNLETLFPVHRLDKMTSGLIILAKNQQCAQHFGKLFSEHTIEKFYLAISDQKPNKKQGLIKGDMAKSRRGSWKLLRTSANPAVSQFFSYPLQPGYRLYLLKPHSGKTHQLRVALNSIGAPIVGDKQYGGSQSDRGYLHAYALRFHYLGQEYTFIEPPQSGSLFISKTLTETLTAIEKPWQVNWPRLK